MADGFTDDRFPLALMLSPDGAWLLPCAPNVKRFSVPDASSIRVGCEDPPRPRSAIAFGKRTYERLDALSFEVVTP